MINIISNLSQSISTAAPVNSTAVAINRAQGFCITAVVTVTTPTAKTFTASSVTSIFTATAHGMLTGLKVQVSNSGGGLPTGLSGATDYFVIAIDANTFKLATTLVNAQAGTNLTISTNGTGTQTVTPTAIAGGAISLQGSNDGVNYADITSSSQNVTATGNLMWNVISPFYEWVLVKHTLTAGQFTSALNTIVKGI